MTLDHATSSSDEAILRELSVLYVEDEATIREQMADLLARRVASVHTAKDGEEGLAAFLRHKPDIVISDIQMPHMNGLEMAEAIKRVSPSTSVIIATAYKDSDFLLKAISLDIDKFLVKPIGKAQLLETLLECARVLHTERRLHASEAKYRMVMEQAADGIFIADLEGRYLDVNPKACQMLGFSREEILGFSIHDLVPPSRREQVKPHLEDVLNAKQLMVESQLRCKNGTYLDVEVSAGVLDGGRLMATVRDITERKRTEYALRESEEKFRLITENIGDMVALLDTEGKRLYNSPSYRQAFGKVPQTGSDSFQDIHPDDRERIRAQFIETAQNGEGRRAEYRLQRDDGSIRHIESNASTIKDSHGKIAKVVVVSRDITDRKLAEEALANSHRMFTTVLDSMDALVYVADMQTHEILFANCYARMATGNELLGKTCWKTLQTNQTAPCEFCTNDRLLTQEGKPTGVYTWEFRNTVNRRWYLIRDQAIRWIDGRIVRMEIATDITDRKEMEEALRKNRNSLIRAQHMAQLGNWEWRILEGMVSYSEETARIAGLAFPPGECTIEEFLKPIHPGDKIMVLRTINAALFDSQPYDLEYRLAAAHGEEIRHVRNLGEIKWGENGKAITLLGTMQDITERKQLEKSILGISEKIRSEIGLELHDELGQQLTGIGFFGKMLENKLATHGMIEAADAARIVQGVADAIDQTRALARGLYPVELAENGLVDALEQLAHNTQAIFGVECTFKSLDPMVAYKDETAIHLYRIAQEAISNAIKHGKANHIQVSLLPDEDGIHLSVSDNGIGLERSASANPNGMGLRIMEYRASLIGATLNILRGAQGGTIVSIH